MCKIRLCCYMLIITNILQCYGESITDANKETETETDEVENEGTESNKIDDEDEKITDNDMNNITENKIEGKVIGGDFANIRDFPHAVFLAIDCQDSSFCGASVLNQRLLLTAAHCVSDCQKGFRIDATAGSSDVSQSKVMKKVKKFIIHRDYDEWIVFCDIALLQLNGDLPLSDTIRRVIIRPTFSFGTDAIIAGWGMTDEYSGTTVKLKNVRQKVWTFAQCNSVHKMVKGTICASSGSSKDYPFKGDSGSGLVTKSFQQIGLVSYKGNKVRELIIYTNVSYYYRWIAEQSIRLRCHT